MDLTKDLDNLISIDSAKREVKDKFKKTSKVEMNLDSIERGIYHLLCGRPNSLQEISDNLDTPFYIYFDEKNVPVILMHNDSDNTYNIMLENHVASYLYNNVNDALVAKGMDDYLVPLSGCMKAVMAWMYQPNPSVNLKIVKEYPYQSRFMSDPERCYKRLNYDPVYADVLNNAPIFSEMLSRLSNHEAFCKMIGKMWIPDADRKQSIWLWGAADSGKSILQRLVMMICGGIGNTCVLSPEDFRGNHWKEPLVSKKLWLVNEATTKFVNSSAYKALTGDGTHQINPKGRSAYVAELKGVFLFSSNDKPALNADPALWVRIIPCYIAPFIGQKKDEEQLLRELQKEIPYIVGYCIQKYVKSGQSRIECDNSDLKKSQEESDWDLQNIFDSLFVVDEKHDASNPDVTCAEFQMLVDPKGNRHSQLAKLMRTFVERKYGCNTSHMKRHKGLNTRWITGIRKLTYAERQKMLGI